MHEQRQQNTLRAEVSGRQVTFWFSAPGPHPVLLDPHASLEDEAGARVASLILPTPASSDAPRGALAIPPGREVRLITWTGEIDLPGLHGPVPRAVTEETGQSPGARRVHALPGRYRAKLFSFVQGDPIAQAGFTLPPLRGAQKNSAPETRTSNPTERDLLLSARRLGRKASTSWRGVVPFGTATRFATGNDAHRSAPQVAREAASDHLLASLDLDDDASAVRAFLAEARLLREGCRLRPGRFSDLDLAEMARLAEIPQIPAIHRELLLRVRRLQIADHDLVTPPILEEDLEVVRACAGEEELFPWFSLKPYDREEFICFDLRGGGLVHTLYRRVAPIPKTPREYLLELLTQARAR